MISVHTLSHLLFIIVTEHKTNFFHTLFQIIITRIIDYFKGLLMPHHLDIFMSGINLGLNVLKIIL